MLLIHHFRKSEGKEGDEVRGSSALMALVDIALLLYAKADNQRSLKTRGRNADSPPELIIALDGADYRVVGDSSSFAAEKQRSALCAALTPEPALLDLLAKKAGVSLKKAYRQIAVLVSEGKAVKHGEGVKGNGFGTAWGQTILFPPSRLTQGEAAERESGDDFVQLKNAA